MKKCFLLLNVLLMSLYLNEGQCLSKCDEKVLICGVCKDVESKIYRSMYNIETLGSLFADYHVVIYENNSRDLTASILMNWAARNSRITFLSEYFENELSEIPRTEKIARARNNVLNHIAVSEFVSYKYLIMVDLDFDCSWPLEEILKTLHSEKEWDCVSANGMTKDGFYWDRYAYRNFYFPFGPELIGDNWWDITNGSWFKIDHAEWQPVYSAFGGLAIYKTAAIIPFRYSGIVTEDLKNYYGHILSLLPAHHVFRHYYLESLNISLQDTNTEAPIVFRHNTTFVGPPGYPHVTCCEHVPLHASMALHGFNRIYVNPKMVLKYSLP